MNKIRSIEQIIAPSAPHLVGTDFKVHTIFPGNGNMHAERMSPFFLLDYGSKPASPPIESPRRVGVYPHQGLETITIAYRDKVALHAGAEQPEAVEKGNLQWLTAPAGILHKKYYEAKAEKVGGEFQMIQLCVNLPLSFKKRVSKHQSTHRQELGQVVLPDGKGALEIIAGNFSQTAGTRMPFSPIELYNARLKKGAKVHFAFPENYNTGVMIVEGAITVNEQAAGADHFVLFANDGTDIYMEATKETIVLILSGEPMQEPIEPYSPFVTNSKQEIVDAYDDWNNGTFGYLRE
jgi:quercetin 2,3-dioxygenase